MVRFLCAAAAVCDDMSEQVDLFGETITSRARPHVSHNSGNNEWYTPAEYIEAARHVMGGIDLDPASSAAANAVVRAATCYTVNDNGLRQAWAGRVWLNPPYAVGMCDKFTNKLCYHVDAGHVTQAIVLVNNATETRWFRRLAESAAAIVFTRGRVRFWRESGDSSTPLQGQAFVYCGALVDRFLAEFGRFGLGCVMAHHAKPVVTLFDLA